MTLVTHNTQFALRHYLIGLYNEYNSRCRLDIEVGTELLRQSGYNKPSKYEKGLGKGQKDKRG